MLKVEKRIAAAECLAVYEMLDDEAKSCIPKEFIERLEEMTLPTIKVTLHKEIPLEYQDISEGGWQLVKLMSEFMK